MKATVFSALIALALVQAVFAQSSCHYSADGVTYDLTALQNPTMDYRMVDTSTIGKYNRTYVFNLCGNTVRTPRDATGGEGCVSTDHIRHEDGTIEKTDKPAPAFVISTEGCFRVGFDATDIDNYSLAPYDSTDLTAGVTVTYKNGDYCCVNGSCSRTAQSALELIFICADDSYRMPTSAAFLANERTCVTSVVLESSYACPTECPVKGGHLCNNHGSCGYDYSNKAAMCYCNDGWYGTDCGMIIEVNFFDINVWAIIITFILAVIVIVTVICFYAKLRKINVNPDAFDSLDSKFNQLGQMTYY